VYCYQTISEIILGKTIRGNFYHLQFEIIQPRCTRPSQHCCRTAMRHVGAAHPSPENKGLNNLPKTIKLQHRTAVEHATAQLQVQCPTVTPLHHKLYNSNITKNTQWSIINSMALNGLYAADMPLKGHSGAD